MRIIKAADSEVTSMRKIFRLTTSAVMVGSLLGLVNACSSRPSDETIAKDIQNNAAADPDTKDSDVKVASKDGKVTLTGTASSQAAQQKLEQIARQEPGIAGVEDQIVVPPPPPPIVVPAGTELVVTIDQALG